MDFKDGMTDLTPGGVNVTDGQAIFTTTALVAGTHTITATYSGDGTFAGSQASDSASPQVVTKDSTSTSVIITPSTLVSGQPAAFIALVSNTSGPFAAPTGMVQFAVDGTNAGSPVPLINGVASLPSTLLAAGSPHTVAAIYTNSDGNFASGSGTAAIAVSKDAASLTLASLPNASVFGQSVSFTATVGPGAPGSGTPTGTVDFKDGATDLTPGGVSLVGGRGTFSISSLSVGRQTITASYSGDANFLASQARAALQVNKAISQTSALGVFPNPAVFGQAISFRVNVSAVFPAKGTPTGTVTFLDGSTTLGSLTLTGGGATFTTPSLSRGNHLISADYSGDGNFLASASPGYGELVQRDTTTTAVTASPNPPIAGQVVTFTAAVRANAPGSGKPTGTVTFKDFNAMLGSGTLNSAGQATFSTTALAVGSHAITATYGGDNNFTASVSAILSPTVKSSLRGAVQQAAIPLPIVPGSLSAVPPRVDAVSNQFADTARPNQPSYLDNCVARVPAPASSAALSTILPAVGVDAYFASQTKKGRSAAALKGHKMPANEDEWSAGL